jgi:hypothetical protein
MGSMEAVEGLHQPQTRLLALISTLEGHHGQEHPHPEINTDAYIKQAQDLAAPNEFFRRRYDSNTFLVFMRETR